MTALIVGNLTQNFARQVGHLTIGETLDSGLKTLKLKDFVPIQYESVTNEIFDSTSVFATESFCLSFIDTETFKCGFVVRREFSLNVLSISVTRNLSQMTYFSKERFHWQATRVIRSKSTGHRRFRRFVVVYPFVFKIRQGGEFDAL